MPRTNPETAGHRKLRRNPSSDVLRQANSGPTPVKNSRNNPTGMFTLLKNGAPTLIFCPCTASEITGNNVPERTAKQAASRTRLLNRKLDSRDTSDSSLFSLRRYPRLEIISPMLKVMAKVRNPVNHGPIGELAKACTELTKPVRVNSVPKIQ